jgi:hypothetical protein
VSDKTRGGVLPSVETQAQSIPSKPTEKTAGCERIDLLDRDRIPRFTWHDIEIVIVLCNTGRSISRGTGLFSYLPEEMTHIIHTTDEGQLQCVTIEFSLPAGQ